MIYFYHSVYHIYFVILKEDEEFHILVIPSQFEEYLRDNCGTSHINCISICFVDFDMKSTSMVLICLSFLSGRKTF